MLRVSHSDIVTDRLVDFDVESRFLKLPIDGYLDAIGIEPIAPQIALVNAINDPRFRFIVACLSRRVGKTYISNIIGQVVLLHPGSKVLIVAPDYNLASISWDLQHDFVGMFDLETKKDNAKDRSLVLENGSELRVSSVSRIDSAVGRSYDLIIFDEAALNDAGGVGFNTALLPTLDKMNSKAIFISTPRGDNWFKEFFDRGFANAAGEVTADGTPIGEGWASIHCNWEANPRVSVRAINQARANASEAEFQQEYEANFVVFEGQVWGINLECIQDLIDMKQDVLASPERWDIIAGLDIGFRDETAMCIMAHLPGDEEAEEGSDDYYDRFYVLDEIYMKNVTTAEIADAIREKEEQWDIDYIFIDSAAQQTRYDLAQIYDVTTINAKKDVLPGIAYVNNLVDHNRLIVDEYCEQVVYSLKNYKWDPNSQTEKPIHDRASHMADAIRYALYTYTIGLGNF